MFIQDYVLNATVVIFAGFSITVTIVFCYIASKKTNNETENSTQQNVQQDEVTNEEDGNEEDRKEIIISTLITKILMQIKEKPDESKESIFATKSERLKNKVFPEFVVVDFVKQHASTCSSCPAISKYLTSHKIGNTEMDQKYDASACAICLCAYEVGEKVSWSPNEECGHAFHTECISNWLMGKSECPVCRRNYLETDTKKISDIELGC